MISPQKGLIHFQPKRTELSRQVFWPFFVLICVAQVAPAPGSQGSQPPQHLSAALRHASRHFRAVKCVLGRFTQKSGPWANSSDIGHEAKTFERMRKSIVTYPQYGAGNNSSSAG